MWPHYQIIVSIKNTIYLRYTPQLIPIEILEFSLPTTAHLGFKIPIAEFFIGQSWKKLPY